MYTVLCFFSNVEKSYKQFTCVTMDKLKLTGQTWAEFTSLEAAVFILYTHFSVEPNSLA
jgi:hypothetical protein